MLGTVNNNHSFYDFASLYRALGKIDVAIDYYEKAKAEFAEQKNYDQYLKCQNALLRIHAESMNFNAVNLIKEEIQDLVLKESLKLTACAYYTLGICAKYKGDTDLAQDYFNKSLDLAFQENRSEEMAYAIFGLSVCYYSKKDYEKALEEVYKLKVFFEVMNSNTLATSTDIMHSLILIEKKRYDEALTKLWKTYERLKKDYDICSSVNVLYALGKVYLKMNRQEEARLYLNLALKSNPKLFKKSEQDILTLMENLSDQEAGDYDLVIDMKKHQVLEKNRGEINFKNQFILLDLMQLFAKEPGKIFSKEDLVRYIWNQDYNPYVHDNKVYVTIKRLRRLVEPDLQKPKYIYRSKNGYFLNQNMKVKVTSPKEQEV